MKTQFPEFRNHVGDKLALRGSALHEVVIYGNVLLENQGQKNCSTVCLKMHHGPGVQTILKAV